MAATKLKIRKDDRVVVLAGKDKGKKGVVLKVMPKENKALVQGVNLTVKHQRQTAQQEA
ncbi:MAG: 50S ribosomal protein L24, partial [Pseudomonadota bacterium]